MKTKRSRLFTYRELQEKEKRNLLILGLIKKRGVTSRTEISKATGINAVSVSNYINNYIAENLVFEKGLATSTGGRKPELVELSAKSNYVAGVDIGRFDIRVSLADITMKVVEKKKAARPARDKDIASVAIALIEETISSSRIERSGIRAIGVAVGASHLISVGSAMEKHFSVQTFTGGSASCAAFAEALSLNSAANVENLLYIHSDIGRGIFISDDMCFGYAGFADDELKDPESEQVIKTGADESEKLKYLKPWDEYLSIAQTAKREIAKGVGTKIVSLAKGNVDNITEEIVVEAARQNDEIALNIIQCVGLNLGLRIAYLINLFGSEVVVFGGGAEKAGDIIFSPMRKMIKKLSFRALAGAVKVIPAVLGEDAVSLGASSLAIREIFLKV